MNKAHEIRAALRTSDDNSSNIALSEKLLCVDIPDKLLSDYKLIAIKCKSAETMRQAMLQLVSIIETNRLSELE